MRSVSFGGVYPLVIKPKSDYASGHPFIRDWNAMQRQDLEMQLQNTVFNWVADNTATVKRGQAPGPNYEWVYLGGFQPKAYMLTDDQEKDASEYVQRQRGARGFGGVLDTTDAFIDRETQLLDQKAQGKTPITIEYDVDVPTDARLNPFGPDAGHWFSAMRRFFEAIRIQGWEVKAPVPLTLPRKNFTDELGLPVGRPELLQADS